MHKLLHANDETTSYGCRISGVTRDEKNLPTPSSNGDSNTGHSWDLMELWTTPAETGQQGEAEEIPIIDFSQLTLDMPPTPPQVVETTSWYH